MSPGLRLVLLALALAASVPISAGAPTPAPLTSGIAQQEPSAPGDAVVDAQGPGEDGEDRPPVSVPPAGGEAAPEGEAHETTETGPATASAPQPLGRPPFADPAPLESTAPVHSVVGSGAPEVLVWFLGPRPGLEELSWRLGVAAALEAQLPPGQGTVHVLVDTGELPAGVAPQDQVFELLLEHPGIVALSSLAHGPGPELRQRPPLERGGGRSFATTSGPPRSRWAPGVEEWLHVGLGLEPLSLGTAEERDAGRWLRRPSGGPWTWAPYRSGTRADQRRDWLAGEPAEEPQLVDTEQLVPGFDTDEVWPADVVQGEDGVATSLSGRSVMAEARLAQVLIERLVVPAQVTTRLVGGPEHLGGDLWQVDLALGAPALQPRAVDPERTYPKARFSVPLSWSGTVEGAAFPSLAGLAWRAEGAEHFEVLSERGTGSGRFGFPGDDLPVGVTLRLVISAPGALVGGRSLSIAVDAGPSGRADLVVRLGASPE